MRTRIGFFIAGAVILLAGAASGYALKDVPVYPLKRLDPKGFNVFRGVLDWTPVSKTVAIAFASDYDQKSKESSLVSFKISSKGVASARRLLADGRGRPWAAACIWLEGGASGDAAGTSFGYVFVLFEVYIDEPQSETASIWMAKFNSRGKPLGSWKEILKIKSAAGRYINDESLFAFGQGNSIAIVSSLSYGARRGGQRKSLVYFIEIDGRSGSLIGTPVALRLPQKGDYLDAQGYAPAWNGQSWLVPVTVMLRKKPGKDEDIFGKKALVFSVVGDAGHKSTPHEIASDMTAGWEPYGDMRITPYPGSDLDQLVFLKKLKKIPEAQRTLDMFEYIISLIRINEKGKPVKSQMLAVPGLTHSLEYDPAALLEFPDDHWSSLAAKNGMLFISRAHSIADWKSGASGEREGSSNRYEQQYLFYAIKAQTGAVTLKSQSFTFEKAANVLQPRLRIFPSGSLSVVNTIWFYSGAYPRWSYFSKFAY